jgi:hypothetical protein
MNCSKFRRRLSFSIARFTTFAISRALGKVNARQIPEAQSSFPESPSCILILLAVLVAPTFSPEFKNCAQFEGVRSAPKTVSRVYFDYFRVGPAGYGVLLV